MARRLSTGISGKNILGSIVAVGNSLRSVVTNDDLILQPTGTGIVSTTTHLHVNSGSSVRLFDNDTTNHIAFKAPATVTSDVTLTFPDNAGTSGYVLQTDGNGVLSWSASGVSITNNTTDVSAYYPTLSTASTGSVPGLRVTS